MTEYAFESGKRATTSISWSVATVNYLADASTPFSGTLTSAYVATVTAAFARWASVSGLTFNQVADGANVPIRIGYGLFTEYGELGETDYRSVRGVLANDTLIRLLDPSAMPLVAAPDGSLAYLQYGITLFQVVLHEIGHALGLDHTTDPLTVMYPYASTSNPDLVAGDVWGINTLYPLFTVTALNPVQVEGGAGQVDSFDFVVTRYSDPGVGLTINYAVTGAASGLSGSAGAVASEFVGGSLPSGQINFAAGSTTALLSIRTVGNVVAQPDQGFTFSLSTGRAGDVVTVRGSTSAVVLDDDGYGQVTGNTIGVYRFFDTQDGTHFYSASEGERNTLIINRPDLVYEGRALNAIAAPSTDPAAAPVFRFFDARNGTHFYSASATERDAIVATRPDLVPEGTAFYEHLLAQSGDQPVFRFFDKGTGAHLYSSSATERAAIAASRPDLTDEGVVFYAPGA